jgi:hypothetical protein
MKTKFIVPIIFVLLLNSCKSIDKLTQFDIPLSQTITIPATLPIDIPFDIPTPPIVLNTETSFELNNTHKELIQEVYLSDLKMSVQTPVGEDFSILKSIEIYISADGESEEKIAWLNNVPESTNIVLEMTKADIKRFIIKDNITLKVKTVTDEINTRKYEIKVDAIFRVNAKILGI